MLREIASQGRCYGRLHLKGDATGDCISTRDCISREIASQGSCPAGVRSARAKLAVTFRPRKSRRLANGFVVAVPAVVAVPRQRQRRQGPPPATKLAATRRPASKITVSINASCCPVQLPCGLANGFAAPAPATAPCCSDAGCRDAPPGPARARERERCNTPQRRVP